MTTRHMITRLAGLLALVALAGVALLSLTPAGAQQIRVAPATMTLSDPVGSTALFSYFYVEARVQVGTQLECPHRTDGICEDEDADESVAADADVNERFARWVVPVYADNASVTWSTEPASGVVRHVTRSSNQTTDSNGRAHAIYRVLSEGSVTISVTATAASRDPVTETVTVATNGALANSPPEPSQILLVAPVEQRRTESRFTVQALVTDANGASVESAPVRWEAIGFTSADTPDRGTQYWSASSADRLTVGGVAEATFTRSQVSGDDNVLVIARAGDASAALYLETNRTAATGTDTNALQLARATGQDRWQLLDPDESTPITLTAELTDADGDPVPDGRHVFWDGGGIPATAGDTVISRLGGTTYSTTTTTGGGDPAGKAQYTYSTDAAGRGYVIARRGTSTTRTVGFGPFQQTVVIPNRHEYPVDVLWFNVGEYVAPPEGLTFTLRLADDSDNVVAAGSTTRVEGVLSWRGQGGFDQILHVTGGRLRIAGNYQWEDSDSSTFSNVISSTARSRGALLREHLLPRGFVGTSAGDWTTGGECSGASDGGDTRWTCAIDLGDSEIVIPAGAPAGTFAVSGTLNVNGQEFRGAPYEVQVVQPGEFKEVAEVEFDFAEQASGQPWPSNIAAGQSTRLRIKSLTEAGGASPAGSISTILVTTNAGSLSTQIGGGCSNSGGLTCEILGSDLNANNADKIDVTLTHPGAGKSGTAVVSVTLVTLEDEFVPATRSVIFLGDATSITISAPTARLLNQASSDDRDVLKLTVMGVDASGNSATVPYRNPRASLRGPDGKLVPGGISVVWTEDGDDADTAHDRFTRNSANVVEATITVTAMRSAPLKTGDYRVELRTANHRAEQNFAVVGGVDSVSIDEPEETPRIGMQFELSATAQDAEGTTVPNGTSIEWSSSNVGEGTALVALTNRSQTTDGRATARFAVVGPGTSYVTASADSVKDVELITVAGVAARAAARTDLSGQLSINDTDTFTVWLGAETLTSEILEGLSGVGTIRVWRHVKWVFYGIADERLVPGSTDILVPTGSVLWLSR